MKPITLSEAVTLCRDFEAILAPIGYHCALTGSVLYRGQSDKDCDIMVYPHQLGGNHPPTVEVLIALTRIGVCNNYRTTPEYNDKQVWIVHFKGWRVDLFFCSPLPSKESNTLG